MQAKMNNWQKWTHEISPDVLIGKYRTMLLESGFNILETSVHFFNPHGFTALFLLSESHFAIHTFPEENRTYLELSSCIDEPFKRFIERADSTTI